MTRRRDFDLLRVCSMLGVIYLHVASGALHRPQEGGLWAFSNPIAALSAAAVPLFFMLSGALLLSQDKTAELGYLLRRRLPRVVVPALCWSGLILGYLWATGQGERALASLSTLLNTPVVVPYWFLYALVPLYLLSPFLKLMTDGMEEGHWRYALGLWAGLTLGLATVRLFVPEHLQLTFTEHWTMNINVAGGYLGYFLLGAYLDRHKAPRAAPAALGALLCLCISVGGTWWDTYRAMSYSTRFTDYLSLLTAALAALLFLLARALWWGKSSGPRLTLLANLSFPMYLAHPLVIGVIRLVWGRLFQHTDPLAVPEQLGFYLLAVAGSFAAAFVLSHIPVLSTLFTGQRAEKRGKRLDSTQKTDII